MTAPHTPHIDQHDILDRVASAYEASRAKRAARWMVWVAPLVVAAFLMTERRDEVSLFALLLLGMVWLADWRGKDWGRALPVGLAGGIVTFGAAISARWVMGDCCASGEGCSDWCVPACSTAGGVAALLTVVDAGRAARPLPRMATSSAVSALGGAMGCACIGYAGATAMLLAMGLVLLPGGFWAVRRPRTA